MNPSIPFDEWDLTIPTTLVPFPEHNGIRRVSVNGFGFAGTNAHAVLDDAFSYLTSRKMNGVHHTRRENQRCLLTNGHTNGYSNGKLNGITHIENSALPLVFSLSAQDRDGIKRVKKSLVDFLQKKITDGEHLDENEYLVDLAHTLNTRRSPHQWKTFAMASSLTDLIETLQNNEVPSPEYLLASRTPRIGFVFTGQGAQWGGMGMELMAFPIFAESIRAADSYLTSELGCEWSSEEELLRPKGQSKLGIAEYSQALCTVLQVALVDLLKHWGIEPTAVTGHSSGEIAAAYCLGALTRENAWELAFYRGILSTSLKSLSPDTHGAMMAVGTSPEKANEYIEIVAPGQVTVACINSPSSVTLSGDVAGIDKLTDVLTEDGIFARKLQVDTAYHSHHMKMVASEYLEAIMNIQTQPGHGKCTMYSSCAGTIVQPSDLGPEHWVRNLVSPVRFAGAVQDLVRPPSVNVKEGRANENAVDLLVEVGPHSALQGPSLQSLKAIGVTNVPYTSALLRWNDGVKTALDLAADLHARSLPVHLEQVNEVSTKAHLPSRPPKALIGLPSYPWNHSQRYWAETRWAREQRMRQFPHLSLLGAPIPSPVAGEHAWRGYMRMKDEPWMADHNIQGSTLYPGAGFLAMAIEAAIQISSQDRKVSGFHLRHVQFISPMVIQDDEDVEFSIVLRPHQTGTMTTTSMWTEFVISNSPDGKAFERNCLGLILVDYENESNNEEATAEKETLQRRALEAQSQCNISVDASEFYTHLSSIGLTYGPTFSNISAIDRRSLPGGGQSSCAIDVPDVGLDDASYSLGNGRPHVVHPALLDAVIHMAFAAMDVKNPWIPKFVDDVIISMDVPWSADEHISGFCDAREHGMKEFKADIIMENPQTQAPVIKMLGLCYASVADEMGDESGTIEPKSVCGQLEWKPMMSQLNVQETAWAVEEELSKKEKSTGLALAKLSEFINLLHHENPGLTLGEVANSDQIVLPDLEIAPRVFATTKYRVGCAEDKKEAIQETLDNLKNKARHEIVNLEELSNTNEVKPDLLIAAHLSQVDDPASTLNQLMQSVGERSSSTLCLVDTASAFEKLNSVCSSFSSLKERLQFEDEKYAIRVFDVQKASGVETNGHSQPAETVILSPSNKSSELEQFETKLVQSLGSRDHEATVLSWDQISDSTVQDKNCISLIEFDKHLLENLSEEDFSRIKQVVLHASHLSWLTGTDDMGNGGTPTAAIMTGVLRTLHNELLALEPLSIMVDKSTKTGHLEDSASLIANIFCNRQSATITTTGTTPPDHEFQIRNGIPYICRALEDDTLNETLHSITSPKDAATVDLLPISAATAKTPSIELAVGKPGLIDSIRFEHSANAAEPLNPDDIEIAVAATSLNFREVMIIMGLLPSSKLGLEAAGTVTRVGSAVKHISKGERVALLGNGAHNTLFRGRADYAFKLPENMSFEEGASRTFVCFTIVTSPVSPTLIHTHKELTY